MVYYREESFFGHVHRHPARIWYEHGADRDGRLVYVRARIVLDGGAYASQHRGRASNAATLRARALPRSPNARIDARSSTRTTRRAARCAASARCRSASPRGADGPARRGARDGPGRAPAAQRARSRRHACRPGQVVDGRPGRRADPARPPRLPVPTPSALPRDPSAMPGGVGNTTRGEGVRRGVGFAVGFKNICFSEGFDDYSPRACELSCRRRAADGAHRRGRGGAGRRRRDRADRAHRARDRRVVLAAGTTRRRLGGLGVGVAADLDGRRRRPRGVPRRARGAGRARTAAARSTSSASTGTSPTTPLDPRDRAGHRRAGARRARDGAMRVVVDVDVELGLTRVVWIATAQDVGRAISPQAVRARSRAAPPRASGSR